MVDETKQRFLQTIKQKIDFFRDADDLVCKLSTATDIFTKYAATIISNDNLNYYLDEIMLSINQMQAEKYNDLLLQLLQVMQSKAESLTPLENLWKKYNF